MINRFFYRIFCGFFLGVSVFAPGFSGSVIAIVMGIYQDIVRIVSNPFKQFKENLKFCLPLGIGAVISAILFVLVFSLLFETYEKATYLLFVGLITGNLPVIFNEIKKCGFQKRYLFGGIVAFVAALSLGFLVAADRQNATAEYIGASLPMMAFGGIAAGVAALIPGMSISMTLILMGVYEWLLLITKSLLHLDFSNLIPFGLFGVCAVLGLVFTSRGIKMVFERFPGFANSMVFGFMSGSLIGVLIQGLNIDDPNFNWFAGVIVLLTGLAVSALFVVLGKKMNKQESRQENQ